MTIQSVIRQHFANFGIRESKVLVEAHVRDGMYHQVIQAGEDAFLRYAQAASQYSEKQAVIRLEHSAEHRADQIDHLLVVTVRICLVQRRIVFVDQQNDLLVAVLFKEGGEHLQAVLDLHRIFSASNYISQRLLLIIHQCIAVQQKLQTEYFLTNDFGKHFTRLFKCQPVHAF